jgi:integrase
MLRSTASHLEEYLAKPVGSISIQELENVKSGFKAFLEERRFRRNSVRTYLHYLCILTKKAIELAPSVERLEVEACWRSILPSLKRRRYCPLVVRYAIENRIKPSDFSDSDLDAWADQLLQRGRSPQYVNSVKTSFRKVINESSLSRYIPKVSGYQERRYGIPIRHFPRRLRAEVESLMRFKTDDIVSGRPPRCKHRPETARNFEKFLGQLLGFIRNVKGKQPLNLREFFSEENLTEFVRWAVNVRKRRCTSLIPHLATVKSILTVYAPLNGTDPKWLANLIGQLQTKEDRKLTRMARARKWVDFDRLDRIPDLIRQERDSSVNWSPKRRALAVRDELLMKFLVLLVWRQRNIRECKLGANLFKGRIQPYSTIDKPEWVENALSHNPDEEFWQVHFEAAETKGGREVDMILPRELVPLLEEYLEQYRPLLVSGHDPGILLLNSNGRPMHRHSFTNLVGRLTQRYVGRRVTPHIFRYVFTVTYLNENPQDFMSASKVLWHRRLDTTHLIYGEPYDESYGPRIVERWRERREAAKKQITDASD